MSAPAIHPPRERSPRVVLYDVSWKFYRQFVEGLGDQNLRVTYADGEMEIMSPLPIHEKTKKLIGRMIEATTEVLNIPIGSYGSTTYSDETLDTGLEPDECYYIQNEARVRGKDRIDLGADPPPDLAVEVDISHRSLRRESIYAAMGVPEVWRYDGQKLECLVLAAGGGRYDIVERSRVLPMIRVADLELFLNRMGTENETAIMRSFRDWVRALPSSSG